MSEPVCPGCHERDALIAALQEQIAALEARVRELETRLNQNSSNSSRPPSADPPTAPKPVVKKASSRKPGGQPGHSPCLRTRLPAGRVRTVIPFVPTHCDRCQTPLPAQPQPGDPEPSWHQVAELPPLAAEVTEYQGHARTCPCCGHVSQARIPAALRANSIGPRLAATLSYLRGCHRVSLRGVAEIAATVFAVPIALGSLAHLEAQMSAALADPHAQAVEAVRQADVKYVDETSWKAKGRRCWLWLAATSTVAAFLICLRRGRDGLQALLGTAIRGTVCSDRWSAYNRLSLYHRQVCWAHLKRDFQKCVDYGGEAAKVGRAGLAVVGEVFAAWHLFRGGGCSRDELIDRLDPVAARLHRWLERGQRCALSKVATFCSNLLALVPALWKFVVCEGLEPTNNHAERLLRRGVLWRKCAFGSQSVSGCRFVERMLTAVQTLKLQKRPVLAWLIEALTAHRNHLPAPSLLPTG
jgi:transposase